MAIPVLTLTRHSWNCFEMWRTPSCHTVQIIFGPKQHSDTEVWDVPTVPKLALCCKGLDVCCATRGEVKREREGGGGGVFHYMSELRLIHMENHFLNTPLILIPHSHPRKGPLPSCLALVNVLTQPTESPDWKAQSLPPPRSDSLLHFFFQEHDMTAGHGVSLWHSSPFKHRDNKNIPNPVSHITNVLLDLTVNNWALTCCIKSHILKCELL